MIRRLGLVGNEEKMQLPDAARALKAAADDHNMELFLDEELADLLPTDFGIASLPLDRLLETVDAVASLGGDGTFLRAAREVGTRKIPLVGINLGSLGFLAEVRVEEIPEAVGQLAQGAFFLEERHKVAVQVWRQEEMLFTTTALNEIALNTGPVLRALDIEVRVDQTHLARTLADGILIASPTGSTAYNLSAGGPILDPTLDVVVLTPICPHTLAIRPLILARGSGIEIRLHGSAEGLLTGDGGPNCLVQRGDRLIFPPTTEICSFIRLPRRNLFRIIQEKLRWGGPQRNLPGESGYAD